MKIPKKIFFFGGGVWGVGGRGRLGGGGGQGVEVNEELKFL